jgi:glycerol-1-phosphate dehydrogenase [NAD(P)+]
MQLLGNSRCASGAEHHISHIIEMQPKGLGVSSSALHGEKVGVGTLIAAREYHRLASLENIEWGDYEAASAEYIESMFGDLGESVIEENKNDVAVGVSAEEIRECWKNITRIIGKIPTYEELLATYELLGAYSTLSEISVPEDKLSALIEFSPLVRNRLTLMRLRRAIRSEA